MVHQSFASQETPQPHAPPSLACQTHGNITLEYDFMLGKNEEDRRDYLPVDSPLFGRMILLARWRNEVLNLHYHNQSDKKNQHEGVLRDV